jgi:GNAT superfamily N-acetyltransferase
MFFIDGTIACRLELANAGRGADYALAAGRLWPDRQVAVMPVAGGYAVYGGPSAPVNHIMGLGWQGLPTEADWQRFTQFYRARGAARQVNYCPLAGPELLAALVQQGFVPSRLYSVLALPLADAPLPPRPAGVEVRRATAGEADLWLHTCAQGFSEQDVPSGETLAMLRPNLASDNASAYLAWIDGQPAGAASTFVHEGVAELGSDAVRPALRRRGVQRALALARLADARSAGCDLAMAITLPGSDSQRNLQRLGFELAYDRLVVIQSD